MKKSCAAEGCEGTPRCRGLCTKHYQRFMKYGDYHDSVCIPKAEKGEPQAFIAKAVDMARKGCADCILWPFATTSTGYGWVMSLDRSSNLAHRRALIDFLGVDFKDMKVLHACRNTNCVNPNHLRWGSQSDNMADRKRDKTNINFARKLTSVEVQQIRSSKGTMKEIGSKFGVSPSAVCNVKNFKTYQDVT